MRRTVDELIAKLEDKDGCDFVKDFAIPFPSMIFLKLMGMPSDMLQQFFDWEQGLLRSNNPQEMIVAGREILEYLKFHLEEQKKKPATPLMESIMNARILDGRPLNDGEILGMFYTFYTGGLDTVYATLGWSMRYIASHPEFQQMLRDNPDKMPKAVDEMLRLFSVVMTDRTVTRDITWHGVELKKGDTVNMPIFVACRDPEAYPNPHEADLDRKENMLAFASGPHLCLGMHLARRELGSRWKASSTASTTSTCPKARNTSTMRARLSMSTACRSPGPGKAETPSIGLSRQAVLKRGQSRRTP